MSNIEHVVKKNHYNFERHYIVLSREFLLKLQKCIPDYFRTSKINQFLRNEQNETMEIESSNLCKLLKALLFKADLCCDSEEFIAAIGEPYLVEYKSMLDVYSAIRGKRHENPVWDGSRESLVDSYVRKYISSDSVREFENFINGAMNLIMSSETAFKVRDLRKAKNMVLNSISMMIDANTLEHYSKDIDIMLSEDPIDTTKVKNYLVNLQQIIIEDWQQQVSDIESYKPGNPFKFICHSTNSEKFDGDFYSSYISCSLLTEEFTDTYRSGFGFIFPPTNLVSADGEDMYVNNYVEDDDELHISSSISQLLSVDEVLSKCRSRRKENAKNKNYQRIYNEVVKKSFDPIAIFCITVGEKELSHNYQSAKKLQTQFPNLKIVEIDLTYYKSKEELVSHRNSLLYYLERTANPHAEYRDNRYYDNFEYFWNRFLELKRQGDYKVTDIIKLYRENSEFLSISMNTEKLFNGNYSAEIIKHTILYNYKYGLLHILEGTFDAYDLIKLKNELISVADNPLLEQAIPGLGRLVTIISKLDIQNISIEEICAKKPITIESITEVMSIFLAQKIAIVDEELTTIGAKRVILNDALTQQKDQVERNKKYGDIINNEYYYSLAMDEYDHYKEIYEQEKKQLSDEEDNIRNLQAENAKYSQEKAKLEKHKILNYFKLRKIKKLMSATLVQINLIGQNKKVTSENCTYYEAQLCEIRKRFLETTGIDLFEFKDKLDNARDNYDSCLEIDSLRKIYELERELSMVEQRYQAMSAEQASLESVAITK